MAQTPALDEPCEHCTRPIGDHTLREWWTCRKLPGLDLPYEDLPDGPDYVSAALGLDPSVIVADHVVCKSKVMSASGPPPIVLPAVEFEFGVGTPGGGSRTVATVLFTGTDETIAKMGTLARDSSRGAVNAAKRGRGHAL